MRRLVGCCGAALALCALGLAFALQPVVRTHGVYMVFYLLAPDWLCYALDPAPRVVAGVADPDSSEIRVDRVSHAPNVTLFHNFLTPDEVRELLDTEVARGLTNSAAATSSAPTLEDESLQSKVMEWAYQFVRTSSGEFFVSGDLAPIVARLALRAERLTGLRVEALEAPFLSRYDPGNRFRAHYDMYNVEHSEPFPMDRNVRRATLLIYLSDVTDGGETEFMLADGGPLRVAARAGSAIIWENCVLADERCVARDWRSLHQGRPPGSGVKYILTFWLRQWPLDRGDLRQTHNGKLVDMCAAFQHCAGFDKSCRNVWLRIGLECHYKS